MADKRDVVGISESLVEDYDVREAERDYDALPESFKAGYGSAVRRAMERFQRGVNNGPGSWDSLRGQKIPKD